MWLRTHRRAVALLVLAPILLGLVILGVALGTRPQPMAPLSVVLRLAARRRIASAVIESDGTVRVTKRSGRVLDARMEPGEVLAPTLVSAGAQVSVADAPPIGARSLFEALIVLGLCGVLAYLVRPTLARGRWGGLTASDAKVPANGTGVTFSDVAGVDEVKGELAEVVEFLAQPERFARIGARIPRGVLLSGPPGTGKTLLARAVAGEAGVPFFSISGAAFVEMYVGVGAARVRDLFAKARKAAPAIVFIDELDAVGGKRAAGPRGGNDEREHTLNQLLVEMDGFRGESGVVVLAATNRPDLLDAALLRPGRFDRRVTLPTPDRAGRRAVLALHAARVRLAPEADLDALAGQTGGMAPADLANVLNEAALLAARERREAVGPGDLEAALLRVLAGPELRSRVLPAALKRVIAYHEVGHALVMHLLEHCDPVAKVQAIARGNALGITVSRPKEDQYLLTRTALQERMVGIMGGRAAEELFFAEITTGAQQDIQQANAIARRMVAEFGMSGLGHICAGEGEMVSEELAGRIDEATRALVEEAYAQALAIVTDRRAALAAIAEHLYAVETMDGAELGAWLARFPADIAGPAEAGEAGRGAAATPSPALGEPAMLVSADLRGEAARPVLPAYPAYIERIAGTHAASSDTENRDNRYRRITT